VIFNVSKVLKTSDFDPDDGNDVIPRDSKGHHPETLANKGIDKGT
jgi:hypothetical protein